MATHTTEVLYNTFAKTLLRSIEDELVKAGQIDEANQVNDLSRDLRGICIEGAKR